MLLAIIAITSLFPIYAHPGKTDSNGGHYDRSTGEYHYHHGYPAHQHPGGKCPYNYDDKTGANSGSSAGSKTTSTQSKNKRQYNKVGAIILFVSLGIALIAAAFLILNKFFIKSTSLYSVLMTVGYLALRTIVVAKFYFVSDSKVLVIIFASLFPALMLWSAILNLLDYIKERRKEDPQ